MVVAVAACCAVYHEMKRNLKLKNKNLKNTGVASVALDTYYPIRQLRPPIKGMSLDVDRAVPSACAVTRIAYCNILYCGITDGLMSLLHSVQNSVAHLITGALRK